MSPEAVEATALRRVSEGGLTVHDGSYVHHCRRVTGELVEALVRLHTAGHLTIGAPGPGGHRPVQTPQPGQSGPPSSTEAAATAEHAP